MLWQEIRSHYPERWLLVEALNASTLANKRIIDQLAVVDSFPDSTQAIRRYGDLHRQSPDKELYVFHTSRANLEVEERQWMGIRPELRTHVGNTGLSGARR